MSDEDKVVRRYDLFISHSTWRYETTHERVNDLARLLERAGLAVFLDRFVMKGGEELYETLRDAIENSGAGILAISSPAIESGWVALELELMVKQRMLKKMLLVALFLEDCPKPVGIGFDYEIRLLGSRDLTAAVDKLKEIVQAGK